MLLYTYYITILDFLRVINEIKSDNIKISHHNIGVCIVDNNECVSKKMVSQHNS